MDARSEALGAQISSIPGSVREVAAETARDATLWLIRHLPGASDGKIFLVKAPREERTLQGQNSR
jgi:hypothetical protein